MLDDVLTNAWNHSGQHMYGTYIQDHGLRPAQCDGGRPTGSMPTCTSMASTGACTSSRSGRIAAWAAQMFGGDKEEYDAVKHGGTR